MITFEKIPNKYEKFRDPQSFWPRNLFIYLLILIIAIFIYIQFGNQLGRNHHQKLLKEDAFNNKNNSNCMRSNFFDTKTLETIEQVFNYFNSRQAINYHICFSTLYFALKTQSYKVFHSGDGISFKEQNEYFKNINSLKCIESDEDCGTFSEFWKFVKNCSFKVHICLLNQKKANICNLLARDFNSQSPKNIHKLTCLYDFWSGEYQLNINQQIKIVIHEYETSLKKSAQLSYWRLQNYLTPSNFNSGELNNEEDINDEVSLKQGLIGYFISGEYFKEPLHMFYSKESHKQQRFVYTNYMNAAVRLPSDVVNYFMIFYKKTWYL